MLSVVSAASQSCCQPWKWVIQHTALTLAQSPSSEIICICVCVPHIVAVATIRGRCLFHSELLIVQLLFEGGVYLKKYDMCHISYFCFTLTVVSRKSIHSRKSAHPLLWPIFLYRVKVCTNECPPWSKLHVEFEKHSLKRYAYLRKEILFNTSDLCRWT